MKRSSRSRKRRPIPHFLSFILFLFLFSIIIHTVYCTLHPNIEAFPESYSIALLNASAIISLAATILKALFPTIQQRITSWLSSTVPDSAQKNFFFVWDLFVFLVKIVFSFLVALCICSLLGLTTSEPETSISFIFSAFSSIAVCIKPYRKKRLERKLYYTNKEIARLEREISETEALKRQVLFESVSFIDFMDGHEFEYWCAELLSNIGFQNVTVTKASGDDGVDIIAEKEGIRYAVQCKCYSSDLGNTPIQEVHAGKDVYRCQLGAVITNRYFTAGGKRVAEATGTLLWDRDWIIKQYQTIRQ